MLLNDENGDFICDNDDQSKTLNNIQFSDIISAIRQQCAVINPGIDLTDYFQVFVKEYLKLPDHEDLEDCTIYIDDRLTEEDRKKIHEFCAEVLEIYSSCFGITLSSEANIYILYCVYKIFVLHVMDYFLYYILGLQKIDEDFVEEIPNWSELSYKYYLEKINHIHLDENTKIQIVQNYMDYVLEYGLVAESYIDVSLLESTGNVDLSALYLESANYRLGFDSIFFNLKLKKILTSETANEIIVNRIASLI